MLGSFVSSLEKGLNMEVTEVGRGRWPPFLCVLRVCVVPDPPLRGDDGAGRGGMMAGRKKTAPV